MTEHEIAQFLDWLIEIGYRSPVALPGGRYAALEIRAFNTRVVTARLGDRTSVDDAW